MRAFLTLPTLLLAAAPAFSEDPLVVLAAARAGRIEIFDASLGPLASIGVNQQVESVTASPDDPLLMRRRQRITQRTGNLDDLLDRESTCGNEAIEWLALDELHGQEVDTVAFFHRVDGDDVRVCELGKGLRLTAKTREPLRIVRHFGGQYLERYVAAKFGVGGTIDLTHTARTERRLDFIRAESCARA